MISIVYSCMVIGIEGYMVEVEIDISNGLPGFDIVGLGGTAIKESRERVRSAIKNSGFKFPSKRMTINLAPADMKKEGSSFDLPLTVGILSAMGHVDPNSLKKSMFAAEVSLEGKLKPVSGILSMAVCAKQRGLDNMFVAEENADEAAVVSGINIFAASDIMQAVNHLNGNCLLKARRSDIEALFKRGASYKIDFADVKGQRNVKRAIEVAASGGHNCLMIGSPGCGKTMIAKRIPTILPVMGFEEAVEVTKIYSTAGLLPKDLGLITNRPFRAPHYTISNISLVGGGHAPRPGEISLAHCGVLFLDEIQEFGQSVLEVLRQPLEDSKVTISRVNASITLPAKFMLICASNPCSCGYLLDEEKECRCSENQIKRYLSKLSGPLLDRMDIHIDVSRIKFKDLENSEPGECSEEIRKRVERTRNIQIDRYQGHGIYTNSQLMPSIMGRYCSLDRKSGMMLKKAYDTLGLSARGHDRILKVARTVADMDRSDDIKLDHLAEAIQYRSMDMRMRHDI
ncbi:MAG: YifB family Mg chelatase-like AAA ATPase [Eubacteriales bacterium]|nr:YifB family Mg chelatase-like AAA ATPase [Eubacteriales bacterium]